MEIQVDIRKKLGSFQLDVSFENESGIMAILGASGCGKSMTLKCIAGIETPDEGRIVLNGRVLYDSEKRISLPPQQRKVGYMFQDYALFPNMTVRKNIEIVRGKRPVPADYYRRFQLEGLEELYPSQLSGGQKQRTAMARMLAAEPEMLLLDEPFSALDAHLRWKLESEVGKLLRELEKPVLFVSHDRDEVYRLSDRVGAMADGKLKGMTPVKEFFHNPKTKDAALLSGCKNVAKAVRRDEYHLFVPGWNITLQTGRPVPFEEGYAGIRAHLFAPAAETRGEENCFTVAKIDPTEDPFEWNIAFLTEGGTEWIQWKVSKDLWQYGRDPVPAALRIAPEDILLLSE